MFSLLAIALSAFSLVSAVPVPAAGKAPCPITGISAACMAAVANAKINFPAGQTNLSVPAGQHIQSFFVGRGTQNYTCGSTGAWSLQGAVATLHDVTCLYPIMPSQAFFDMPKAALTLPYPPTFSKNSPNPIIKQIAQMGSAQGQHYFITEPAGSTPSGNQPKFDFTNGNPSDATKYVTGTKTATLNAADPTKNVAWLQLTAIPNQGSVASTVFRVDTAGGQPATTTCTAGQTTNVQYAAMYAFAK